MENCSIKQSLNIQIANDCLFVSIFIVDTVFLKNKNFAAEVDKGVQGTLLSLHAVQIFGILKAHAYICHVFYIFLLKCIFKT